MFAIINKTPVEIKTRTIEEYNKTIENIKFTSKLNSIQAVEFGYSLGKIESVYIVNKNIHRYPVIPAIQTIQTIQLNNLEDLF